MSSLFAQPSETFTVCAGFTPPTLWNTEGDKWKVIPAIIKDFIYSYFEHQAPTSSFAFICSWFIFCLALEQFLLVIMSTCALCSSSCSLVKPFLFSWVSGYKYLYTGNLSRQVRCTCRDEVMSPYPPLHLFKCSSSVKAVPLRSIMSAFFFCLSQTCSMDTWLSITLIWCRVTHKGQLNANFNMRKRQIHEQESLEQLESLIRVRAAWATDKERRSSDSVFSVSFLAAPPSYQRKSNL